MHRVENYISELSIHVASFEYEHCFSANAVPWRLVGPKFIVYKKYRAENGNLRNPRSTFSQGTMFAPKECLYQMEATATERPKMHFSHQCKTSLAYAGLQTTPSQVSQYRAEKGNLRNSGSTFSHGTTFTPKQCFIQKEAAGMESLKIYSSCRCKNLNYLWGTANDPVSRKPV